MHIIDLVTLANADSTALSDSATVPYRTLREICDPLDVAMDKDSRNVGHRAKCSLHALITMALLAAARRSQADAAPPTCAALPSFLKRV